MRCQIAESQVAAPPVVYDRIVELGTKKAKMPFLKALMASVIGGAFIGYGAYLCLCVGGSCPGLTQSNPGLGKLLFGLFGLPFGLLSIILTGTELFTGNTAVVTAAVLEEKATATELLRNWVVSFVGNFMGVMLMIYLFSQSGIAGSQMATTLATTKTSLTFMQAFLRGILANWLVCLAVWCATAASTLPGKVLGVFIPISSFVAMGFEHSIANMFFVPFGIYSGSSITFSAFLLKNLLPVTLGNIVGGALMVGAFGSLMWGKLGSKLFADSTQH